MGLAERLVETGVELLEEEGLGNLTLRSIARRAGVSHGAPRRYFATHNELLAAIAKTGLADLDTRLKPVDDQPSEEQLIRAAEIYLRFAAERPEMFELIFRHDLLAGAGGNLRATSVPLFQRFADVVGELRATALWTNIHGLAVLRATGALGLISTVDAQATVRHIVRVHLQ